MIQKADRHQNLSAFVVMQSTYIFSLIGILQHKRIYLRKEQKPQARWTCGFSQMKKGKKEIVTHMNQLYVHYSTMLARKSKEQFSKLIHKVYRFLYCTFTNPKTLFTIYAHMAEFKKCKIRRLTDPADFAKE